MNWLDATELEALEKLTAAKKAGPAENVRQVEEQIDLEYLKAQTEAIEFFGQFQAQNEMVSAKLDDIQAQYSKVETDLKERMREMIEVTLTMEVISQRQASLETVQKNFEKLDAEVQRRIDIR